MAQPNGPEISPVFQDVVVESSRGEGRAIAVHWTGNSTLYLVVSATDPARPVWLDESEISVAYVGGRPGREPGHASW